MPVIQCLAIHYHLEGSMCSLLQTIGLIFGRFLAPQSVMTSIFLVNGVTGTGSLNAKLEWIVGSSAKLQIALFVAKIHSKK